jgi:hypothetical protein
MSKMLIYLQIPAYCKPEKPLVKLRVNRLAKGQKEKKKQKTLA